MDEPLYHVELARTRWRVVNITGWVRASGFKTKKAADDLCDFHNSINASILADEQESAKEQKP